MNEPSPPEAPEAFPPASPPTGAKATKSKSSWLNLLVDFGPLLVFFLVYNRYAPANNEGFGVVLAVTKGTIAFMVATVVALVVSKWRLGHVSPMVWLSTVLILGFGSLTVFLNDPWYIQIKPTVVYLMFAGVLFAGLARGKAMLRYLLQSAFEGLDDEGWMKLSRNWALFFLFLAGLNEALRHLYNTENGQFGTWLWAKVWVFTSLSFVFTFTQIPMLMRHGLALDAKDEAATEHPHD